MIGLGLAINRGALPGFVLKPANNRIALDGHSFGAYEWSPANRRKNQGFGFWWQALAQGAVRIPYNRNFAVAGQTSADILARVDATLAGCTDCGSLLVMPLDVNDRGGADFTAQQSKDNITAYISAVKASGKTIFYVLTTPHSGLTTQQQANLIDVRQWAKSALPALAPRQIVLVDVFDQFLQAGTTCDPITGATLDGTHPTPLMAQAVGAKLLASGGPLFAASDVIAELLTGHSNIVVNPTLSGTGGSHSGSGTFSGTVPTSWVATYPSGTSVTASSPVAGTQQMAVVKSVTGAGNGAEFYQNLAGLIVDGDTVQFAVEVEVTGTDDVTAVLVGLRNGASGTTFIAAEGYKASDVDLIPSGGFKGVYFSGPVVVSGLGANPLHFLTRADFAGIGSATFKVSRPTVIKVA